MASPPSDRAAFSPDPRLPRVRPVLGLLTRQPVLLAVTLEVMVAGDCYEVTVSKAIDEAGMMLAQYCWEVDKLTADEQGQSRRQKRWRLGHRLYETAEAAYLAAVESVQTHVAPAQ